MMRLFKKLYLVPNMKDYSEYFREAVASFLAQNPALQKELACITVDEAESIGTTVETLHSQVMNQRFVEHATQLGIDTNHLVLQFIDASENEKNQILKIITKILPILSVLTGRTTFQSTLIYPIYDQSTSL